MLANQYRADLAQAGFGDGRHSFEFRFATPLDPFQRHEISVYRAADREHLVHSPAIVDAALAMDAQTLEGVRGLVGTAVAHLACASEADALLELLVAAAERVRERRTEFLRGEGPMRRRRGSGKLPVRRALVIDETWPRPDRDAGSQAILGHMRSLRRLGWQVSFVAKTCTVPDAATAAMLLAEGFILHAPPAIMSVEEVLSRQANLYQLVYLHRGSVAGPYVGLVRHYQRDARIVYNVADLHHLRVVRQAHVEGRPELIQQARWLKQSDLATIRQVDAVITHSTAEASKLAREDLGAADLHVVPWTVPVCVPAAARPRWEDRHGLVFVANFAHLPIPDGLAWLVGEVLPLVHEEAPDIMLTVVGEGLPASLARQMAGARVRIMGHLPDLAPVYAKARLAVAPLRFGAGLKGKVLEAWSHGLPCVMTPVAAEGLPVDNLLSATVAQDSRSFAKLIVSLHHDRARNAGAARAARIVLRTCFTQKRVDAALAATIGGGEVTHWGRSKETNKRNPRKQALLF